MELIQRKVVDIDFSASGPNVVADILIRILFATQFQRDKIGSHD